MNKKNRQQFLRLPGILVCLWLLFVTATSWGYESKPCVMDNGGGKAVSSNYTTLASIGQAVIGGVATSNYKQEAGYLSAVSSPPELPPWDVNKDGIVNILDLVIVARNFGQTVPPADPRADVNNDGIINILDLVLVAKHFGETTGKPAPALDTTIITHLSQVHSPGDTFTVDIKAEDVSDIYGFEFELGFNPGVLEVVEIREGSFLKADGKPTYWMQPMVDCNAGRISGAGSRLGDANGVDGSGILASVVFKAKGYGMSSLQLRRVLLSDSQARAVQGAPVKLSGSARQAPTETNLLQNYPNPFNPECWIPFELSERTQVVIRIYNIAGQLIRTLDLGVKEVGVYVSKDAAAYWNGHNDDGQEAASGVYFYQLQAGSKVATKKMVVLK